MGYLKHIVDYFKNSYTILSHGYIYFRLQYTYILFLTFLKISPTRKRIIVTFGSTSLSIPHNFVSCLVMQEIFIDQLYKRLHGLTHILDLGGFIGDSAVYLSKLNSHVTVLESDPRNFEFCQINTRNIPNITLHNAAVTGKEEKRYIIENNEYWGEVAKDIKGTDNALEITTISIQELEKHNPDGIKMDIEGGEYELISYWLGNNSFSYKKGFIEFHFFQDHKHSYCSMAYEFVLMIQKKGYIFEFFGNDGKLLSTVDTMMHLQHSSIPTEYINIYFERI